jgi:hypothetical protein
MDGGAAEMTHERPTEALSEGESDLAFGWSAISQDGFDGKRSPKQLSWMFNNTNLLDGVVKRVGHKTVIASLRRCRNLAETLLARD